MRSVLRFVLTLLLLVPCHAGEKVRFRQWILGTDAGGVEVVTSQDDSGERIETRTWTQLERKLDPSPEAKSAISDVRTEEIAMKKRDGSLEFSWKVFLSAEPLEGRAHWSPKNPEKLQIELKDGAASTVDVPKGAVLWPGDEEDICRQAARSLQPIHMTQYSFPEQLWGEQDLQPIGPEPLPGFPDAVHFHGKDQEGPMLTEADVWISPRHGEVKRIAKMGSLVQLVQREELPIQSIPKAERGFFERTLAKLPPHPFLLWIPEAELYWKGSGVQKLPEDDQQKRIDENRYRVRGANPPTEDEAAEMPVTGQPRPDDAPYLASTPLVQFKDPAFDGLIYRLNAPEHATRWELAKRVTDFVFEWIKNKDLAVGFASALEVAHTAKGDCTEHGVLAVALLRKLGVPARGVVGWVALDQIMGLHFWVEVKLKNRWIPVDPTFDQAPASALRLKMDAKDLADLAALNWDTTAFSFLDGAWVPGKPWVEAIRVQKDCVISPDGTILRMGSATWTCQEGLLTLAWRGAHEVETMVRPSIEQLKDCKLLAGSTTKRRGYWFHKGQDLRLWMDLGNGRWLQVDDLRERDAFEVLDALEVH